MDILNILKIARLVLALPILSCLTTSMCGQDFLLEADTGKGRTPNCLILLREGEFAFFCPSDPESFKEYDVGSLDFRENARFFGYQSDISSSFLQAIDRFPRLPISLEFSRKVSGFNVKYIIGRNVLKNCRVEFMNSQNRILVYSNTGLKSENRRIPIRYEQESLYADFDFNGKKRSFSIVFGKSGEVRLPRNEYIQLSKDAGDQAKDIKVQVATESKGIRFETIKMMKSIEFESMAISNVCISEGPETIGWGLLQRFDFALNFDDAPTMEILGSVNDHDCTQVLLGDFESNLEELGIQIGTIYSEYWSAHLKNGDRVVKGDRLSFRGWMLHEIKKKMRTIQKSGGTLTVLRDNVEIEIRLPSVD